MSKYFLNIFFILCLMLVSNKIFSAVKNSKPSLPAIESFDQLWNKIIFFGKVNNTDYMYQFELEDRFCGGGLERNVIRLAFGYNITNFSLWLGYDSRLANAFEPPQRNYETRIWPQIMWPNLKYAGFKIENRTRFENRKRNDDNKWLQVLRHKWIITFATERKINADIVVYDEPFFNLDQSQTSNHRLLNENRFYIGVKKQFTKKFAFEVGYLNRYVPNTKIDEMDHIMLLTFTTDQR